LWSAGENNASARERLLKLGVDEVVTRIADAADVLRQLAEARKPPTKQEASNQETPKRTVRR
jgi:hypothetical protein